MVRPRRDIVLYAPLFHYCDTYYKNIIVLVWGGTSSYNFSVPQYCALDFCSLETTILFCTCNLDILAALVKYVAILAQASGVADGAPSPCECGTAVRMQGVVPPALQRCGPGRFCGAGRFCGPARFSGHGRFCGHGRCCGHGRLFGAATTAGAAGTAAVWRLRPGAREFDLCG